MKLTHLGHAFWLLEAGGLRIAMDPILGERHTSGLFEIIPRRTIDAASLRPDFIFISHAHLDHFDTASLHRLAELDPDTIVVTSDPLISEVCETLGFRDARVLAPGTRIDLDAGLTLTLTPSAAPDIEWGVLAADPSGVAWNLIDTLLMGPAEVRRILELVSPDRRVDLALAPLQPMREIALATAGMVGFEPKHYRHLLECCAAIDARCVVPSAAGDAHAPPFEAMNAWVYPVSAERAAADYRAYVPGARVELPAIGEALLIDREEVHACPGDVGLLRGSAGEPRRFAPVHPAPLIDPNFDGVKAQVLLDRIIPWIKDDLAPAIAAACGGDPDLSKLRFVLEVVLNGGSVAYSLDAHGNATEGFDPEYDVLNAVAGSMLVDVIEGRRGWYEPLLAGCLRSVIRGCAMGPGRARPIEVGQMFVYEAIGYRESTERAARWRARRLAARGRG